MSAHRHQGCRDGTSLLKCGLRDSRCEVSLTAERVIGAAEFAEMQQRGETTTTWARSAHRRMKDAEMARLLKLSAHRHEKRCTSLLRCTIGATELAWRSFAEDQADRRGIGAAESAEVQLRGNEPARA